MKGDKEMITHLNKLLGNCQRSPKTDPLFI
ncbi:hypothetical protein ArsFIN_41200 [Arsenophonus nasoniae]|nr:hypothetical protein ArsFIN_41200 [Arsenophonus nasoniae]